jgi:hypothetical protein
MKLGLLTLVMLTLSPWLAWPIQPGHVELGVAYTADNWLGLLGSWQGGPTVAASACRALGDQVQLEARASYRHAAFEEFRGYSGPHIPETQFSEYRGDASDVFTLSVGPRFTGRRGAPAYMSFRGGLLIMRLGDVTRTYWDMNNPDEQYVEHARGTGTVTTEAFVAGAIGVALPIGERRAWVEVETGVFPRLGGLSFTLGSYVRFGGTQLPAP